MATTNVRNEKTANIDIFKLSPLMSVLLYYRIQHIIHQSLASRGGLPDDSLAFEDNVRVFAVGSQVVE